VIREDNVAFTNVDGGSLIIRVEDKARGPAAFTGCTEVLNVNEIKSDVYKNIYPALRIEAEYHDYCGAKLLEIKVQRSQVKLKHTLTDGKSLIRVGAENLPYLESRGGEFLSAYDLDYSINSVSGLDWNDLDRSAIVNMRSIIQATNPVHDYMLLDDYELAKALNLVTDHNGKEAVTLSRLLFIGKKSDIADQIPQSEIITMEYDEEEDILQ
jgi:predicted HTH transcriptional regulator